MSPAMMARILVLANDVFSQRALVRELAHVGQVATVETLRDAVDVLERSDTNTVLVCDTRIALREEKELRGADTSIGARMLFLGGGTWDPCGAALAIGMRASLLEKPYVRGDVGERVCDILKIGELGAPEALSA